MVEGWLDEVTDATIWGRVTGEGVDGPAPLRIEVDGRLWGYAVAPEAGQPRKASSSAASSSGASSAMWWPEGNGRPRRSGAQGRQTARTSP